jgi:hypothetical protein
MSSTGGNGGNGNPTGGNGGATGGGGGATGGGGGGKSTGGSGGGGAVTFSQVASLLSKACAGSQCHGGSNHINLVNMTGLYMRLTTPLPSTNPHCGGTTLIVAGSLASSFLANVIKGQSTCMKGGGTEMIPRMPDDCSTSSSNPRACLTAAEIKLVEDWVTAGAPQ